MIAPDRTGYARGQRSGPARAGLGTAPGPERRAGRRSGGFRAREAPSHRRRPAARGAAQLPAWLQATSTHGQHVLDVPGAERQHDSSDRGRAHCPRWPARPARGATRKRSSSGLDWLTELRGASSDRRASGPAADGVSSAREPLHSSTRPRTPRRARPPPRHRLLGASEDHTGRVLTQKHGAQLWRRGSTCSISRR